VWGGAFDGLHLMLGYQTEYYRGGITGFDNTPSDFANFMLGNTGQGVQPIAISWFLATEQDQPEGGNYCYCGLAGAGGWNLFSGCSLYVWPAAMGQLGPNVTRQTVFGTFTGPQWIGWIEYYPSSSNPGLPPSQIQGWWYINER
jgi:hypothetical protein